MSAREELMFFLTTGSFRTEPAAAALLDAVLSMHAHELAEKIRASNTNDSYSASIAIDGAADLIDPEVSDG